MRFGLGWRPEIGAGILANLASIDVVEVLVEDYSAKEVRALRFLASQFRSSFMGRLGWRHRSASVRSVSISSRAWSIASGLLLVRTSRVRARRPIEIGHLAPRRATMRRSTDWFAMSRRASVVGSAPLLENVATLIDPPLSTCDEAQCSVLVQATGTNLLLDLHNLHANATNFGFDARRDATLAAGSDRARFISPAATNRTGRILDDHLHDVPDPVRSAEEVARRS